jgi:hypothetical protein
MEIKRKVKTKGFKKLFSAIVLPRANPEAGHFL